MPSQYKCCSERGIPQRCHLQCCFADLWQQTGKDRGLVFRLTFIDEKRRALASYKSSPSERILQMLRKVQQISTRCANDFWLQLCNRIQVCADTGNLKGMRNGIKQAIGPIQSQTAPLKSATGDAIKDKSKQMERWMEHYSEFYSKVNVVSEDALMAMESLCTTLHSGCKSMVF